MQKKPNILIVEDARIIALSMKADLENHGYTVTGIVDNGDEAITVVEEENPDLVLMDINLKGRMDGIEASEIILRNHDVPIIYLTAYADEKTIQRARATSPYGYLIKPYEERNLIITIDFAMDRHELIGQIKQQADELKTKNKELRNNIKHTIALHREISKSEEQLRDIFESAHDSILIANKEGRILKMNPAATTLFPSKIKGKAATITAYFNHPEMDAILQNIKQHMAHLFELDYRYASDPKDVEQEGKIQTIEAFGKVVVYDEKPAIQFIIRDISLRKETQRNVLRAIMDTEEQYRKKISTSLFKGMAPLIREARDAMNENNDKKNILPILDLTIRNIEEIAEDMSPTRLDAIGFINTMESYLQKIKDQHHHINFICEFDITTPLPESTAINLYRFVDELITNSIKHSMPQQILLSLVKTEKSIVLSYQDDGKGCTSKQLLFEKRGLGIRNMISRVHSMQGHINFQPNQGKRFTAHIEIPS